MSRVRLSIDRLLLRGFAPGEQNAVVEGLQGELARFLAEPSVHALRSHRTPVMKLGRLPLEPGAAGGKKFGTGVGKRIGRGLQP